MTDEEYKKKAKADIEAKVQSGEIIKNSREYFRLYGQIGAKISQKYSKEFYAKYGKKGGRPKKKLSPE